MPPLLPIPLHFPGECSGIGVYKPAEILSPRKNEILNLCASVSLPNQQPVNETTPLYQTTGAHAAVYHRG